MWTETGKRLILIDQLALQMENKDILMTRFELDQIHNRGIKTTSDDAMLGWMTGEFRRAHNPRIGMWDNNRQIIWSS